MPLFLYLWLVQAAIRCSDEMHDDEQLRFDNLCLNLNEPPRGSRPATEKKKCSRHSAHADLLAFACWQGRFWTIFYFIKQTALLLQNLPSLAPWNIFLRPPQPWRKPQQTQAPKHQNLATITIYSHSNTSRLSLKLWKCFENLPRSVGIRLHFLSQEINSIRR